MLLVVSPAKALDETPLEGLPASEAHFLNDAETLATILKAKSPVDIGELMSLSEKLSELNYQRFQDWQLPLGTKAKQAVFLFKGDVYQGIAPCALTEAQIQYLQNHLRILSGLYGLLSPLDKILPYRLEMGTKLANPAGENLYHFWQPKLAEALNEQLVNSGSSVLVNLASNEYFKAVQKKTLNAEIITPIFKDYKNGKYKIISFYAKKARGLMARYAAVEQIENVQDLKQFDYDGYQFCSEESNESDWVFKRNIEAK